MTSAATLTADQWQDVRAMTDVGCVTVGPQLSYAIKERPDRLVLMYARYWAAAHLIGNAQSVLEVGASEGAGSRMLAAGRRLYMGIDTDAEAIRVAKMLHASGPDEVPVRLFAVDDIGNMGASDMAVFDAAVSLDVIEHVPQEQEQAFVSGIAQSLTRSGICVIGTPNATAEHLASPPSRIGHVNLFAADRLKALMERHFRVVIMAGMQDTAIHFGRGEMAHYLLAVGFGPR